MSLEHTAPTLVVVGRAGSDALAATDLRVARVVGSDEGATREVG